MLHMNDTVDCMYKMFIRVNQEWLGEKEEIIWMNEEWDEILVQKDFLNDKQNE